jgi:hypothetical protein
VSPQQVQREVLSRYLESTPSGRVDLLELSRHYAHLIGVSLFLVDEFQHLTSTSTANSALTGMMLNLSEVGIPVVYGANYSLGHRLRRRAQEDTDRLLSEPVVLQPNTADSREWRSTLVALQGIDPDSFTFDVDDCAMRMHSWTGGIKRYLGLLLLSAYRIARENNTTVDAELLSKAFECREYARPREIVYEIARIALTGKSSRQDLVCPFKEAKEHRAAARQSAREEIGDLVQAEVLRSSLSPSEKRLLEEEQRALAKPKSRRSSKVSRMEDFRQGEDALGRLK